MGYREFQGNWREWSGRLLCLTILFTPFTLLAEPVGKHIVDEAIDVSDANTLRLELRFITPVNYLWHFPRTRKDEFLIAVQPITGLASFNTAIREHIRIPPALSGIITNLYYDGTEDTNRFVVLETNRDVGIVIKQGQDMKNIIIEFQSVAPEPASECDSKLKKESQGDRRK